MSSDHSTTEAPASLNETYATTRQSRGPVEPKPPHPARFCAECGQKFYPKIATQIYHSPGCQKTAAARALNVGYKLYPFVMAWRIDRNKKALSKLCLLVEPFANDEREIRRKRAFKIASYQTAGAAK